MRTVLHLLTTPPDALTRTVLDLQQAAVAADRQIEILDLSGPNPPDYAAVLERIFLADSVSTW